MSSTAYRDRASRWRPALPEDDPAVARRATRLLRWQSGATIVIMMLVLAEVVVGMIAHRGDRTTWSAIMTYLGAAMLALIAVDVAVTWWLLWRMAKAEAGGVGR